MDHDGPPPDEPDASALPSEELFARLYDELHGLAAGLMNGERAGHTLQPTALLHEAWAKLATSPSGMPVQSRRHLVFQAARAMRQVLVDHARARAAVKRGRRVEVELLDDWLASFERRSLDVLDLNTALGELSLVDEELVRLVELRFFGGLSVAETADTLELSVSAVERRWRTARAWLLRRLRRG